MAQINSSVKFAARIINEPLGFCVPLDNFQLGKFTLSTVSVSSKESSLSSRQVQVYSK